jgi:hypothetical protein
MSCLDSKLLPFPSYGLQSGFGQAVAQLLLNLPGPSFSLYSFTQWNYIVSQLFEFLNEKVSDSRNLIFSYLLPLPESYSDPTTIDCYHFLRSHTFWAIVSEAYWSYEDARKSGSYWLPHMPNFQEAIFALTLPEESTLLPKEGPVSLTHLMRYILQELGTSFQEAQDWFLVPPTFQSIFSRFPTAEGPITKRNCPFCSQIMIGWKNLRTSNVIHCSATQDLSDRVRWTRWEKPQCCDRIGPMTLFVQLKWKKFPTLLWFTKDGKWQTCPRKIIMQEKKYVLFSCILSSDCEKSYAFLVRLTDPQNYKYEFLQMFSTFSSRVFTVRSHFESKQIERNASIKCKLIIRCALYYLCQ